MNIKFINGQMRHCLRYKKHYKMSLIYKGNANEEFLEKWFERMMINFDGTSLGTYNMKNEEVIINELANY